MGFHPLCKRMGGATMISLFNNETGREIFTTWEDERAMIQAILESEKEFDSLIKLITEENE